MRDEQEIIHMLQRFDDAIPDGYKIKGDTRAAWDVLCWAVDESRPDSLVADYLPEEQ